MPAWLYDYILHLSIPHPHIDPLLDEFTYGDSGREAKWILENIRIGDVIFFHVTMKGSRYVTSMYVVDKITKGEDARRDPSIVDRYRNAHIGDNEFKGYAEDVVLFGNPDLSKIFHPPILLDRKLAERLAFDPPNPIEFNIVDKKGRHLSDLECIASATRTARKLTREDTEIILKESVRKWPS